MRPLEGGGRNEKETILYTYNHAFSTSLCACTAGKGGEPAGSVLVECQFHYQGFRAIWGGGRFHVRRNDFLKRDNFYFARIGAVYWVSDELTLVGGYAHLWLSTSKDRNNMVFQDENRVYQQIQWRQKVGRVTFIQRIRNEQRWHEVLNENGGFLRTRFSNRIRFLSSFSFDIFNDPYRPSLVISDELLVHFGKDVLYNTFDQNRIFAGLKVPVTKDLKFDIGYMMVYQQHSTGMSYDMNHTFRFFLYYSPDLRKEKDRLHYSFPGDE